MKAFTQLLQKQWQSGGWLSTLLTPLSTITAFFVEKKIKRYKQTGQAWKAPHPVIVVGNIFVGGTGKTPVVISIIEGLKALGYTPGVISRGYGVKIGPNPRVAGSENANAKLIGDEPALIAQYAPISVHPKRVLAVKALCQQHPEVNLIISDDGLQHIALHRDIEIIVQDARGIGNGKLLPAGPLREPARKLNEVDFIINNVAQAKAYDPNSLAAKPIVLDMCLEPVHMHHLASNRIVDISSWLDENAHHTIAAIAGIGNPNRFFTTLEKIGMKLNLRQAFKDHASYNKEDFKAINSKIIVMTEKDAIKCQHFNDDRFWALKVRAQYNNPNFFTLITQQLGH